MRYYIDHVKYILSVNKISRREYFRAKRALRSDNLSPLDRQKYLEMVCPF